MCATIAGRRSTASSIRAPARFGGCTAHNAMILVYPHNADWDGIAQLTGDPSWRAEAMRRYFIRLENCHYRPLERWLAKLGPNPSRHGWDGWLHSKRRFRQAALGDFALVQVLLNSAAAAFEDVGQPIGSLIGLAEVEGRSQRLAAGGGKRRSACAIPR